MFPRYRPFVLLVILVLSISFISSIQASGDSSNEDVICVEDGSCYPRLFEPTTEFQKIKAGQDLPPGLHVRLNIYTGEKEAKLMDNEDTTPDLSLSINREDEGYSVVPLDNVTESVEQSVEDVDSQKFSTPPADTSKPNAKIPISDHQRFVADLEVIMKPHDFDENRLSEALDSMEDLVHEIDFGKLLAKDDGLSAVVNLMSPKWPVDIRLKSATIIGSAVQNNPPVQHSALKLDLVSRVLENISSEQHPKVLSRYMYAFSSIVRGNKQAIRIVNERNGLTRLAELYPKHQNEDFQKKCAVFVTDFLNPDMEEAEELTEQIETSYNVLRSEEMEQWCNHLQRTLLNSSIGQDTKEKTIRGLSMIKSQASESCLINSELQPWIKLELSEFENDQDFDEYVRMLRSLEQ
ncbi:nucleotide exchange factor sil1 [Basidiobolus ranarum]|uniref:Nucleotide exchange factor SIL1 n=1 Tax=Basidiobolus ranarum TaxID=34480 RepID=A0ABR2WB66_9FUNG